MPLEKRHKVIIGGLGSLLVVFIVANSIFLYWMYAKQDMQYNELIERIDSFKADSQTKFNELTESIIGTETELNNLGSQIGSLDDEMTTLKASASADFSGVIEDAIRSVVTIRTDISQGSGFIVADGGYIVTNAHVMEGAKAASIITYDGEDHGVIVIGKDNKMDIALLSINTTYYNSLSLANSNNAQVGEKVIAIGNPLGLQFSVSEGIISAVHREGGNGINAYIQTDAALNPGNSGGPLINKEGEVVGINNFKVGDSENIGFALESNYIKNIINEIFMQVYEKNLI